MDERRLCERQLIHSLCTWGIGGGSGGGGGSNSGKSYADFRARILREGLAMIKESNNDDTSSSTTTFKNLLTEKITFPHEYEAAIRHVLETELETDIDILVTDRLHGNDNIFGPPYYLWTPKYRGDNEPTYRLSRAYEKVPRDLLNPFQRYMYSATSQEEAWFNRWFLSSDEAGMGLIFEAIVTCYALYNVPCFHCKRRNVLRWNGGSGAAWQDMVCIGCNSTFEIKTKATLDKVNMEIERNDIRGGSFRSYCRHKNSIASSNRYHGNSNNQKMFLAILPRSFIFQKNNESSYPVFCMEIDQVSPRLSPLSFKPEHPLPGLTKKQRDRYHLLYLQSNIEVKQSTKKLWFNLPKWEPFIDWKHIMEEVYMERFGRAEFERRKKMNDNNKNSLKIVEPFPCNKHNTKAHSGANLLTKRSNVQTLPRQGNIAVETSADNVSRLQEKIKDLALGENDDLDWEELYDD